MPQSIKSQSINPWTKECWGTYSWMDDKEVEQIVTDSQIAFHEWRAMTLQQRLECYKKFATELRKNKSALAELIAREMGKPVTEGESEVEKCASTNERMMDMIPKWLEPEKVTQNGVAKAEIHIHPLGIIMGIMPWNFPLWQVVRFAVTTLSSGNTVVVKPAPNVTMTTRLLKECYEKAFPKGVVQFVEVDVDQSHRLLEDPRVHGVSLTGSTRAGFDISARAGKLMKKCVLELGGSDPYLIFEDADLDVTVKACIPGRFANAGQSCVSAKRWIVHSSVDKKFIDRVLPEIEKFKVDDPLKRTTNMGPLARVDLLENLDRQVQASLKMGAKALIGGRRTEQGFGFEPTLLVNIGPDMPAVQEELFGPVAVVQVANSLTEMIKYANETEYGLGSAIFTKDMDLARRVFREVQSGSFFVNDFVKSDASVPFGGVKHSGIGRELSRYGCLEFTNVRTLSF